jgi:2-keto-3-deoxy-L-rhamnonate aldolase RhmA
MPMSGFNRRLQSGQILGCYVSVIPSAVTAQAMAATGAARIIFDQEHGPIGPESLHAMIAATAGTECAPFVRVPKLDEAWVKPALDSGAEGLCFPHINSADDAVVSMLLIKTRAALRTLMRICQVEGIDHRTSSASTKALVAKELSPIQSFGAPCHRACNSPGKWALKIP